MRVLLAPLVVACGTILSEPVLAGPAYTAKDILNHFTVPEATSAARGICVGTEEECGLPARASAPNKAAAGLDLLVTFDLNSFNLTPAAKENLEEFAKALADPSLAGVTFEVDGHTDARGTDAYNIKLSEERAAAVVKYLAELGIDPSKLIPKGFGKAQPRTADPYDGVNRRVETHIAAQ